MESANRTLHAALNLYVRQMRVTRNMDDNKDQDPFFTLYQFNLVKAAWDKRG